MIIGREIKAQHTYIHISSGRIEHGDGIVDAIRLAFSAQPRNFTLVEESWATCARFPDPGAPDGFAFTAQLHGILQQRTAEEYARELLLLWVSQ